MIVDRTTKYLDGDMVSVDPEALETAANLFKKSLVRNFTKTDEKRSRDYLSASSPWYCARKITYALRGVEGLPIGHRGHVTFGHGDAVEIMGIFKARHAGVDFVTPGKDGEQKSGKIVVAGEEIRYHMDATVRDPAGVVVPVDWKSMSEIGFKEFERAISDPSAKWWTEQRFNYLSQLYIYMLAEKAPYGIFVGQNKNTGAEAEMHVPFDPSWLPELEERVRYIAKHRDAGTIPDRPAWATTEKKAGKNLRPDGSEGPVEEIAHYLCGYCDKRKACWPEFEVVPLKSGPKFRRAISPEEAGAVSPARA